tara:strand:+ start:433 stop:630 length:198 start_codon:yes stop_codon:yes gene_type:complete
MTFKGFNPNQHTLHTMKTQDTTVGTITTKENAALTAAHWHNPRLGYHAQVIAKNNGFICRLVIND